MATIRSRNNSPNKDFPSSSISNSIGRQSLAHRGDRKLRQRRPKQKSSCLGVVTVFLVLVVLVVVATVQNSLRGPPSSSSSTSTTLRSRNLKTTTTTTTNHHNHEPHSEGQPNAYQEQEEYKIPSSSSDEDEEGSLDHIDAPRDNSEDGPILFKEGQPNGNTDVPHKEEQETEEEAEKEAEVLTEELVEIPAENTAGEESLAQEESQQQQAALQEEEHQDTNDTEKPQPIVEEQQHQEGLPEEQETVFEPPVPKRNIQFCESDFMKDTSNEGFANPAIIVLGMEDSSTDMVWHVISQIFHPDVKSRRMYQMSKHATAIDYGALSKNNPQSHEHFWENVSSKSHGKWLVHVLCQQEQHGLVTGFPWVSTDHSIAQNEKALETLTMISTMPKGSVKVVRVKRNYLDVLIRQAQMEHGITGEDKITLEIRGKLLAKLRGIKKEQEALDQFLQGHNVEHMEVDFESLYPFDHWTDMIQATVVSQQEPVHLVEENGSSAVYLSSRLERTWRDLLDYLEVVKPMTLFDVLQDSMRTHLTHTFWTQKDAVANYAGLLQTVQGTTYQKTLRKEMVHIDSGYGEGDEM